MKPYFDVLMLIDLDVLTGRRFTGRRFTGRRSPVDVSPVDVSPLDISPVDVFTGRHFTRLSSLQSNMIQVFLLGSLRVITEHHLNVILRMNRVGVLNGSVISETSY